ncbi:MAG: hypothetical protein Q8R47_05075 [Nanoarchaeota archaeon]|nr:hypothetical protein [Nanoarchaeota archaeon]
MKITIKPEVFKKFPQLKIGFISATGIDNKSKAAKANHLLTDMQKVILLTFNKDTVKSHNLISPWDAAKAEFGKKAKHYHTSVEILLEKILHRQNFKTKDTVTALLRYIALKHIIPFGADDPAKVKGELIFEVADKDLRYRDEKRILGKKLDYWKNAKTALKPSSTSALLHFEFLPPVSAQKQKEIMNEAADLLQGFCGGEVEVLVLDKKKNSIILG